MSSSFRGVRENVEELGVSELKVRLRAGMNSGNWQRTGDQVFEALADNERPVVLAIDELPILVNRLLKGKRVPYHSRATSGHGQFSWDGCARIVRTHQDRVCLIISGSVGLEPVLSQAKLSAHANVYRSFDLKPWTHDIAVECLAALARGHGVSLPEEVRDEMCRRLRCCVPHHVQTVFSITYMKHLTREQRKEATLADVARVYQDDLLGPRGRTDLLHYEERLETVLGDRGCAVARSLLTSAAVNGGLLEYSVVESHRELAEPDSEDNLVDDVLHVLEHDGYLEGRDGGLWLRFQIFGGLVARSVRARHFLNQPAITDETEGCHVCRHQEI